MDIEHDDDRNWGSKFAALPQLPSSGYLGQDLGANLDDYIPPMGSAVSSYEPTFASLNQDLIRSTSPPQFTGRNPEGLLLSFGQQEYYNQNEQQMPQEYALPDPYGFPGQEWMPADYQDHNLDHIQIQDQSQSHDRHYSDYKQPQRNQRKSASIIDKDEYAVHPNGYQCAHPGCEKVFQKHTNLRSHLKIHHTDRQFQCSECGASFRRSHDLKRHQRSLHSEVKPYLCTQCGKGFSRMVFQNNQDALKRHNSRISSTCFHN